MSDRKLTISFDGTCWYGADSAGNGMPLLVQDEQWLPELPEGYSCEKLLLPGEYLLARAFMLPLGNPRLLDEGILGQELDDRAGVEPDEWWLVWQAERVQHEHAVEVGGMVFGMPEQWKQTIEHAVGWQHVTQICVDGWSRLQALARTWVESSSDAHNRVVLASDQQGLFFGLWQDGVCKGLRRINRHAITVHQLAEEVRFSLLAMGGEASLSYPAIGLLDDALCAQLALTDWQGTVEALDHLPLRHSANVASVGMHDLSTDLNFRHGRWASASHFAWIKPWQRSMAFAALLLLLWVMGLVYQNASLSDQNAHYQQQMIDSFHKGLPQEKVMLDPLAQLQQAAGGGASSSEATMHLLQQIAAINVVYKKTAWEMRSLTWKEGKINISGKASTLQLLNTIRQQLQQQTGAKVTLVDTDLSGDKVIFRMQW
ncbi:MAG: type II secretion system protein GspL [Mariprofundus sp.]|nr:type II secretion system protein GspL [Mariprofundus sp.]